MYTALKVEFEDGYTDTLIFSTRKKAIMFQAHIRHDKLKKTSLIIDNQKESCK